MGTRPLQADKVCSFVRLRMKLHTSLEYLRYRIVAGNAHGLHSPFVFELFNNVIRDDMPFYTFEPIEYLRRKLQEQEEIIELNDLGAGGETSRIRKVSVKQIAGRSLNTAKYGRLLFRLVNRFQPKTIVELGTSLGITTLYLAMPSNDNTVYTIEGSPSVSAIAREGFRKLNRMNIRLLEGNFDTVLPGLLQELPEVDMAYVDGNHRYEPTMRYFEMFLSKKTEQSFFVFDDIYWSREMTAAWNEIRRHPEVTVSIDLFRLGIVFFRKGIPKQDFVLKY